MRASHTVASIGGVTIASCVDTAISGLWAHFTCFTAIYVATLVLCEWLIARESRKGGAA